MTTEQYLNDLVKQKNNLVDNLVSKGVTASKDEKLNTLVPKVLDIETGITPTGTKEITENGTYDVTNYASANVNIASSGGTSGGFTGTGGLVHFSRSSVSVPMEGEIYVGENFDATKTYKLTILSFNDFMLYEFFGYMNFQEFIENGQGIGIYNASTELKMDNGISLGSFSCMLYSKKYLELEGIPSEEMHNYKSYFAFLKVNWSRQSEELVEKAQIYLEEVSQ